MAAEYSVAALSAQVWPRSSRVPNVINLVHPPLVTTRVGDPVELSYEDPVADTEHVHQSRAAT